jgi:hypothetical protein
MALYGITEEEVALVVKEGKREDMAEPGRVSFTWRLENKSNYPIKVVGVEKGKDFLIITAYPLKRGRT